MLHLDLWELVHQMLAVINKRRETGISFGIAGKQANYLSPSFQVKSLKYLIS